jgi:protein-disulfide isomerase
MRTFLHLATLLLLLGSRPALGAPCHVPAAKKPLFDKLLRATYPYDCCDETLERCLAQKRVCRLARRLRDDICRRLGRGEEEAKVKAALERRARSMTPTGKKASFDLTRAAPAGEPKAKLTVVVYACARCPFCARVVPELYRLATAPLKGKVALHFRPFPISSHKGSLEGSLAMVAAARLGKLWPYLQKLYGEYDRFSPEQLPAWATAVGLDRAAFTRESTAPVTRAWLVESKKEGIRNGVDATPALFIDGRRYYGSLDPESLQDALEEALDRSLGRQHD